jgi:hypothetical protein
MKVEQVHSWLLDQESAQAKLKDEEEPAFRIAQVMTPTLPLHQSILCCLSRRETLVADMTPFFSWTAGSREGGYCRQEVCPLGSKAETKAAANKASKHHLECHSS